MVPSSRSYVISTTQEETISPVFYVKFLRDFWYIYRKKLECQHPQNGVVIVQSHINCNDFYILSMPNGLLWKPLRRGSELTQGHRRQELSRLIGSTALVCSCPSSVPNGSQKPFSTNRSTLTGLDGSRLKGFCSPDPLRKGFHTKLNGCQHQLRRNQ